MKILIVTVGTRGDVQPYVALGKGLRAAGHTATICTSARFESFIEKHGLNYAYMNNGLMELLDSQEGREAMSIRNLWELVKVYAKLIKRAGPLQKEILGDAWKAAESDRPDLIIYHPKGFGGPHYAEKLGARAIFAPLQPMFVPTAEFPNFAFPEWNLGGWYNKLTYQVVVKLTSIGVAKYFKAWRKEHGLPPWPKGRSFIETYSGEPIPVLHGHSPFVIPQPSDWPPTAVAPGYWFLDADESWTPPKELEDFLAAGEPPVYVGFGSMAGRNPERLTGLVVEALKQAGVRGIIASGWGGLKASALPKSILTIEQAPHDWLFQRVAAVVHHGGAGTTAAGLRAGRPTVVCAFFGDQPAWGRKVHALGVGPEVLLQKKLTAEKLAEAIRYASTDGVRERARALGEKLRAEDGVAKAVRFVEDVVGVHSTPRV